MSYIRIIAGERKGRRIQAPENLPVRPTTDFAKEALFNILSNYFDFDECTVLDLFAGTGNISYEFASRGARFITAVDNNIQCVQFIQKTAALLTFQQITVVHADAITFLKKQTTQWDIIFSDPPFDFNETIQIPDIVFKNNLLTPSGMLIIEHSASTNLSNHPQCFDTRKYGSLFFSFFSSIHEK